MSVIINLVLFPTDKGQSVSPYVARVVKIIEQSGLPYDLHSMGTCVEGEWDEVMSVTGRCFKELERDCDRIYLAFTADYRKGASGRMKSKIASVQEKLSNLTSAGV
jgi:uncharacterized protein (TIGR00106 family)